MEPRKIVLPEGLDWDTVQEATEAIEAWELRADASTVELVITIYRIVSRRRSDDPELLSTRTEP